MPGPSSPEPPTGSFFEELRRRHVVRVALAYGATGWLVLQLAGLALPAFGAPPWVLRVLFGIVLLLFPIALVLAWAFEVTPEGVRRTEPAVSAAARPVAHGRSVRNRLNTVTIVALAAAVAVLSWRLFSHPSPAGAPEAGPIPARSIAVLPLANGSGDPKDQYFSDGLSEDLIIALSRLPGLKVIGRESSFQMRDTDLDSRAIGEKLGVAHLLEGSVARDGGEVRLRAELVNAQDGSTLWSESYDRPYRNLFELQDDLTRAVATALRSKLLTGATDSPEHADRPPSGSIDAYNAYLEGNFDVHRFNRDGYREAIEAYRRAVRIDPRYAAAYAEASHTWARLAAGYLSGAAARAASDSAAAAADRALSLDPDLSAAHRSRAFVLQYLSLDWKAAEAEFRKALELAPGDARAKSDLAGALATLGRVNEAVRLQREALTTNPLDAVGHARLGYYLLGLRRYDDAVTSYRRVLELQPAAAAIHAYLALAESLRGDTSAARVAAAGEPDPAWGRWATAMAAAAAGDSARADSALQEIIAKDAESSAYQIADVYALREDPSDAFEWLGRAWRQRDPGVASLLYDPALQRYRDDPRFAEFCRTVGLPVPGEAPEGTATAASS